VRTRQRFKLLSTTESFLVKGMRPVTNPSIFVVTEV